MILLRIVFLSSMTINFSGFFALPARFYTAVFDIYFPVIIWKNSDNKICPFFTILNLQSSCFKMKLCKCVVTTASCFLHYTYHYITSHMLLHHIFYITFVTSFHIVFCCSHFCPGFRMVLFYAFTFLQLLALFFHHCSKWKNFIFIVQVSQLVIPKKRK